MSENVSTEKVTQALTWILGTLFVIIITAAITDRVSIGSVVQNNTTRITRLEEQQSDMEAKLDRIDIKLDRIIECQVAIQRNRDC